MGRYHSQVLRWDHKIVTDLSAHILTFSKEDWSLVCIGLLSPLTVRCLCSFCVHCSGVWIDLLFLTRWTPFNSGSTPTESSARLFGSSFRFFRILCGCGLSWWVFWANECPSLVSPPVRLNFLGLSWSLAWTGSRSLLGTWPVSKVKGSTPPARPVAKNAHSLRLPKADNDAIHGYAPYRVSANMAKECSGP